mmetsp:Transcript_28585/g.51816  ORF Transcript_28585/g.51816 Transcript_28585/m.51816 type:complete len:598 (+) Transcript_28585:45-1838(+)|eukprot:CAMPEP_0197620918 /NCGR_PEP_ID=MMETSP1338-20131121/1616_1 /TAXON_ID=43686 ORGANISM="Pelagodinium beii, Strain RCC1491" /NCGR_SAMPLE_ID=MMETSP1338 /ASSEMBLY_ACC=CAM_ASM_000754 /LENGTH=597 /DNA_ID=CAMNT_0043190225 /DNA_START=47 /DNA_END=1840 /DNA_ORIENTATION=-
MSYSLGSGGRRLPTPSVSQDTWYPDTSGMTSSLREEPVQNAQKPSAGRRRPGSENVPPGVMSPPAKSPKKMTSPGKSSGKENDQDWLVKRKLADKEVSKDMTAASDARPFVRLGQPQEGISRAANMQKLVDAIRSNEGQQLIGLGELRKALGAVLNPPMQEAIEAGAAGLLAETLGTSDPSGAFLPSQLEAAWCLTQLASGNSSQTRLLVEAGAVDAALEVLLSPRLAESHELCERCLMLLANVAGDADRSLRDQLLGQGVVGIMGNLFEQMQMPAFAAWSGRAREEVLRALTWLMSSLCRGRSNLEELDCAFDYFSQVIQGTNDAEMKSSALWGLCHLLEGSSEDGDACAHAARMLSAGFEQGKVPKPPAAHPLLQSLVESMRATGDRRSTLPTAALRLAGLLVSLSDPFFTDALIASGPFLQALHADLVDGHADGQVQRDAAWVLGNIAAGSPDQAKQLSSITGLVEALCCACERSSHAQVRSECMWAIANLAKHGRIDNRRLLQISVTGLRREQDPVLQRAILDAVEAALLQGTAAAEVPDLIQQLQELAQSSESAVYRKARYLLQREKIGDENEEARDGVNSPRRRDKYKYGC